MMTLVDDVVGEREQFRGHHEAKRFSGPQIDDQLQFWRELYRQVGRFGTPENLNDISGRTTKAFSQVDPVAYQSSASTWSRKA